MAKVKPVDTLLVVDSMIGQEALNIAQGFKRCDPITGLVLTKMDGDSRGGAAISIRSVTGVPIKFIGTGEKLDALETYDPARLVLPHFGHGRHDRLDRKSRSRVRSGTAQKSGRER
jgi:signal recognition particle subunit SRP54